LLILLAFAAAQDLSAGVRQEVARQECRHSEQPSEDIVVCGNRRNADRYRVTDPKAPFDVGGNQESVARERAKWVEDGDIGIQSCSPVGPGGWTGCMLKEWRKDRQQRGGY
jgi:hypothetical protein